MKKIFLFYIIILSVAACSRIERYPIYDGYTFLVKGKYSGVSRYGKLIIPIKYQDLVMHGKTFIAKKDDTMFLFDSIGKPIMSGDKISRHIETIRSHSAKGEQVYNCSTGFLSQPYDKIFIGYSSYVVEKSGLQGVISFSGKEIIPISSKDCVEIISHGKTRFLVWDDKVKRFRLYNAKGNKLQISYTKATLERKQKEKKIYSLKI